MAEPHLAPNAKKYAKISYVVDLHLPPERGHCWSLGLLICTQTRLIVD